jgi:hypothetical protein
MVLLQTLGQSAKVGEGRVQRLIALWYDNPHEIAQSCQVISTTIINHGIGTLEVAARITVG